MVELTSELSGSIGVESDQGLARVEVEDVSRAGAELGGSLPSVLIPLD